MARCKICTYTNDDVAKVIEHFNKMHAGDKNDKL